jgi:hypothetical protein
MLSLFEVWLGLPVRYIILNINRFGRYCEKSIRLHFEQGFDFAAFNMELIRSKCGKDLRYYPKTNEAIETNDQISGSGRLFYEAGLY